MVLHAPTARPDSAPAPGGGVAPDGARPLPVLRGHLPALDGVRGLAILMVLLLHFVAQMQPTTPLERGISWVLNFGAFGVELFFVLSGFLITGILADARAKPHYFRNFYMRRLLRIFPLYYGVLAVLFFLVPLIPFVQGPHLDFLREHQAWAWLYAVNIYIATHGEWALSYIDHFWSLCIEEHFYFFWPLVVWALGSRPRRLMQVSLALAVGAMAARLAGNVAGIPWWTTYVLTPFRLDGLALGGFLAMLVRQPGGPALIARLAPRFTLAMAGLVVATYAWVLVSAWGLTVIYPLRVSLIIFLLAGLLMWVLILPAGSPAARLFRSRAMVFLGTYSYGLYVYHHFLSYWMMNTRTEFVVAGWVGSHLAAVLLQAAVGIAASIAIAWLSYELFEKRFLELKRFFEPAR
jgi:peptidoglycan/LPS O-acetylase OafA/YrhL